MSVQKAIMSRMVAQPCTIKWLGSLLDPFNGPQDACNPYTPPIFSERTRPWGRTQLTTGSFGTDAGAGMAAFVVRMQPASDVAQVLVSATINLDDPADALSIVCVTPRYNNSRYTSTQFSDTSTNMQWAPVSLGVRIRYVGPAESMQGRMFFYESDPHQDVIDNDMTITQVLQQNNAIELPISYEWQTLLWSGPVLTNEFNYNIATANIAANPYCLAVVLVGVNDTAAQAFAIEYVCNVEVSGVYARATQLSERDSEGAGNVQSAVINVRKGKSMTGVGEDGAAVRKPGILQYAFNTIFPDYQTPNPRYGAQWGWLDTGVQYAAQAATDYLFR